MTSIAKSRSPLRHVKDLLYDKKPLMEAVVDAL